MPCCRLNETCGTGLALSSFEADNISVMRLRSIRCLVIFVKYCGEGALRLFACKFDPVFMPIKSHLLGRYEPLGVDHQAVLVAHIDTSTACIMVLAQNFDTLITQCGFGPVDALPFGISIAFIVSVKTASATITSVTQAFTPHIMLLIGRFSSGLRNYPIGVFVDELREMTKVSGMRFTQQLRRHS